MLDIEFFAGMAKFMYCHFHLVHEGVHLSPILVVDVCNVQPALLQHLVLLLCELEVVMAASSVSSCGVATRA
jgi:hypothetical protein